MIAIIITCILLVIIFVIFFWSRKYVNPYRLYMVFGRKGSGKSTYMCKLAVQYYKRGYNVFANCPVPYATVIDIRTLGSVVPPPKSVLLVDEVGMIWDNRNYKAFREDVRDYFKLQRHYYNIVYLFSQTFDIDLKLRNLTDAMYLCVSPIPILTVVKRIKRTIVLVQPVADAEGKISDSLEFVPFWQNLFGAKALQLIFIPRWAKYFDSHAAPELPVYNAEIERYSKKNLRKNKRNRKKESRSFSRSWKDIKKKKEDLSNGIVEKGNVTEDCEDWD